MNYFSLKAGLVILAAMLLNSHIVFAAGAEAKKTLFVVQDSQFSVTGSDEQLSQSVIQQLQSDAKLAGYVQVSNRNGAISISGTVASVSMIYRIVEITKDLPGVQRVDVSQLDT
ncbi:BON domain-containing protein [Zhongshania guokunii]|uniref:BON domain-containing protein n=1 Tax=Zhongshania guokunii TaxID=641783 RepID=A0ABV3U4W5_9GAMM